VTVTVAVLTPLEHVDWVTREVTVIVGPETVVAEGQLECIVIWLEQDARADEVKVIVDDVLVGLDEAVAIIKQEHTELNLVGELWQ
jgi:hypothetical protein